MGTTISFILIYSHICTIDDNFDSRFCLGRTTTLFHFWRENTLRLELRHLVALSHSETGKGNYIRTTRSKLESSSPVCIQIGLLTLVELDYYVGTKTASLSVSQKFWCRPNLREWWVGIKILGRMVMQLDCKGSLIAANKPTKNNSRSLVGDFRNSNLEGFLWEVKCEAHSQLVWSWSQYNSFIKDRPYRVPPWALIL